MTIGVLWEFFEFGMDIFFNMDMQKDALIQKIVSVKLNPAGQNNPVILEYIKTTKVLLDNGRTVTLHGYLDIGLIDTMKDLAVNFVGAVIFSVFGYLYLKNRDKHHFAARFIPQLKQSRRK
jgi:hypothetical protein